MTSLSVTLDEEAARRLTERIRSLAVVAKEQLERLQGLLAEARDGEAWRTLGYQSWTHYLSDVMGEQPLRLPRDQRQEIVGYLAGEGMSSRAIAPIVGATHATVQQDVKRAGRNLPPEPAAAEPRADVDKVIHEAGFEPTQPGPSESPKVTGLDGKKYTRPEPKMRAETPERPDRAMSASEANQDRQQQEAQALALALVTLSAFQYPQARQRYRESWAAQPYSRGLGEPYYNPNTIRELARSLTTYANELEEA